MPEWKHRLRDYCKVFHFLQFLASLPVTTHHSALPPRGAYFLGETMRRLKTGTAGVAVAALALTLAACGSDSDSDSNTESESDAANPGDLTAELTWWDTSDATNEAPAYDELIAKFNEEYPNVTVKHETVPFDQTQNKFKTAAAVGLGCARHPARRGGLDPRVRLLGLPLQPRRHRLPLENELPGDPALSSNVYEDKTYGVPQVTDTLGLMYNKALFEQGGPDPEAPPDLGRGARRQPRRAEEQGRRRRHLHQLRRLLPDAVPLRRGCQPGRHRRHRRSRSTAPRPSRASRRRRAWSRTAPRSSRSPMTPTAR